MLIRGHTSGYGNAALLELPVLEPFRCSRKWVENGPEWCESVARAELYDRCHQMGDIVVEGLTGKCTGAPRLGVGSGDA